MADADGLELTSSQPPERTAGGGAVVLRLTVEGTDDAVDAAVARVRYGLPPTATITVEPEAAP